MWAIFDWKISPPLRTHYWVPALWPRVWTLNRTNQRLQTRWLTQCQYNVMICDVAFWCDWTLKRCFSPHCHKQMIIHHSSVQTSNYQYYNNNNNNIIEFIINNHSHRIPIVQWAILYKCAVLLTCVWGNFTNLHDTTLDGILYINTLYCIKM